MSERSWLEAPDLVIETKHGKATLVFTGDGHIYLDANHNCVSDPSVGLTVHGVRYGVSAHLHFREAAVAGPLVAPSGQGTWTVDEPYLWISRADTRPHLRGDAVSRSARAAIRTAIEAAVAAAVARRPDLVRGGEARALNNRLHDLDGKIAETVALLETLKVQRAQEMLRLNAMDEEAPVVLGLARPST